MLVYFCSTCGATVPEQSVKAGTAVLADGDKVHCFKCVTSRAAKVSDSKVYRALLAKKSEGGIKKKVRGVSQRLIAQIPTGKFKRVVRRVSERLLGPSTGQFSAAGRRIGSSPRHNLPASSAATVAAVTRKRTEANSLAMASIACVVIAIFTLILFMASGKKTPSETANNNTPTKPTQPTNTNSAPVQNPQPEEKKTPPPSVVTGLNESPKTSPVSPPKTTSNTVGVKEGTAPLPPLLTERNGGDFKDQIATDRLNEAKAYFKENPKDPGTYQKKLNDIINTYRNTPVADEATRLLKDLAPAAPPKVADSLDWFANWQVDNLYKHAKAKMYEEFDNRKFVLETNPPEAEKELRLKWKMPVPTDKPIFEFSVRANDNGDFDMIAEVDGVKAPIENIRGAEWRTFALDLSARKGQEANVVLHHAPTGWDAENAYWQAPQFTNRTSATAKVLAPGSAPAADNPGASDWSKAVNLITLVDPLKDSVAGTWTAQDGSLSVSRALYARTEIPYTPPQEYDLRVTFTRVDGSDNVVEILSHNGKSFAWNMGGANNTVFGFETIAGVSASANPTTVRRAACLENGKKYTSLVQVRDGGVKAYLDGKLLCEWKTDYSDMDIYADWKLREANLLGLGSWNNQVTFHSAELLEVKGKGKAGHSDKSTPGAPFSDVKIEYERTLLETYAVLSSKGIKPAIERAEQAKNSPALAPLRSKVELDAECFGYLMEIRRAALAGAQKLSDNRAFTFTKNDGKEINVGTGSGSVIKEVGADAITIEQTLGTSKAIVKLSLDELSGQTQQDLAKLGMASAAEANLKLTMVKLARWSHGSRETLSKEIKASLEAAAKDPALTEKAEHMQSHLSLLERDYAAQQSFKKIEALVKTANWRQTKAELDIFKAEFGNSYAYERVRAQLEQWGATADKESQSPLLKR